MPLGHSHDQGFDPEHIMDEWRRLYDWAVLSRQTMAFIEEVSFLGQRYSSVLNAYQQTAEPQRRTRLYAKLTEVYTDMRRLYDRLDGANRIALSLHSGPS